MLAIELLCEHFILYIHMSFSCYDVTFLLFEFNVCKSVCERITSQILAGFIFYFIWFGPYTKHCKIRFFYRL